MKMKKKFLLFSMIVVLFSLTACSDGKGTVQFNYTDTDIITSSIYLAYNLQNINEATKVSINNSEDNEVYQAGISNFENANEECGDFVGYASKQDGSPIMMDLSQLDTSNEESLATFSQFVSLVDATVEEDGDTVRVVLNAIYEDRDVEFDFAYGADNTQAYMDATGKCIIPYTITEVTVSPNYTFGEKMAKAAANTLMGMGTVFVILIFISLIISQFERISKIGTKKKNVEQSQPVAAVSAPVAVANPMEDTQLVAVITAAIMAENVSTGNSSDKLVVRSIKRAKR